MFLEIGVPPKKMQVKRGVFENYKHFQGGTLSIY